MAVLTCKCGKELIGSLDTFGDLDNPVCLDCWFETGELRSAVLREAQEHDKENRDLRRQIRGRRRQIEELQEEISGLEGEVSALEDEIYDLEQEIEENERAKEERWKESML